MNPEWERDVPAADLTSMRCGGPIAYVSRPESLEQVREVIAEANRSQLPIKVLGGGSDLVFADEGFSGLVIQPRLRQLDIAEGDFSAYLDELERSVSRPRYAAGPGYLELAERADALGPTVLIQAGCDVSWGQLVQWTLSHNLHGLHRYARIPCKVGGAVYNNIHAGDHLFQELVCAVQALSADGETVRWYGPSQLKFGYDRSRFQASGEIILCAVLALIRVSAEQTASDAAQYREWTAHKARVQPSGPNVGSVFKNLEPEQAAGIGQEALAAGWYVEQCGFKGRSRGGMRVYPGHANFIVNTGQGRQSDLIDLVEEIRTGVHERFGIRLEPEVECVDTAGNRHQWLNSSSD